MLKKAEVTVAPRVEPEQSHQAAQSVGVCREAATEGLEASKREISELKKVLAEERTGMAELRKKLDKQRIESMNPRSTVVGFVS